MGSAQSAPAIHHAIQHGHMDEAIRMMTSGPANDQDMLLSAVLSGKISMIEMVLARCSKETTFDHCCIFIACALGDARPEVWEFCRERFPCEDMSAAIECSLRYETYIALEYLLNKFPTPTGAKLWCKNVEQLKMIHAKNESWPRDFLSEIDDKEMCKFYRKCKLVRMMDVIEEMQLSEGHYLTLCNLMKEMHDAL